MNVRTSSLSRRIAVGAGALVLVGSLAACSSSGDSTPAASTPAAATSAGAPSASESAPDIATVLSEAAQASSEAESAAFTLDLSADVTGSPSGDMSISANGSGASTSDGKAGEVTMNLSVPGAGEYALEAKIVDETTYLKATGAQIPAAIAGKWIKLDAEDLGVTPSPSASPDAAALAQVLAALDGATDVQEVGTEVVEGTDTTHYTATLDIKEFVTAAAKAAGGGAAVKELQKELDAASFDPMTIGVWVDGDKLVRKVAVDFSGKAEGTTIALTAEIVVTGYDVPVEVTAPPANEVVDGKQLLGSFAGMAGATA